MKRKHSNTYDVLPFSRFSNNVGGGRTDCDGLDTDAGDTIIAAFVASRSPTSGKYILLSVIICGLLALSHTLITEFRIYYLSILLSYS